MVDFPSNIDIYSLINDYSLYDLIEFHIESEQAEFLKEWIKSKNIYSLDPDLFQQKFKEITNNQVLLSTLVLSNNYTDTKKVIKDVLSFVFFRLQRWLLTSKIKDAYPFISFISVIQQIDDNELLIPMILHYSRALIDTDSSALTLSYMHLNINLKKYEKNQNILEGYYKAVAFFKNFVVYSNTMKLALKIFVESIGEPSNGKSVEELVSDCQKIMTSICFVAIQDANFYSMCGFNQKVYANLDNLYSMECEEEYFISRGIANMVHESAHIILRDIKQNFVAITPRGKINNKETKLESGYRLENILFGPYNKTYWFDYKLADEKFWKNNNDLPVFKESDFYGNRYLRRIENPDMSGIEDFFNVSH